MKKPKKYPKFNPKGLKDLFMPWGQHQEELMRLWNVCEIINKHIEAKYDNPQEIVIIDALSDYVLIKIVSTMEDYFKNLSAIAIDYSKTDIVDFFVGDNIKESISYIKNLNGKNITDGEIIVSNYTFQNLDAANDVISEILKLDYFETLLDIFRLPKKIIDEKSEMSYSERQYFAEEWGQFKEMFQSRNYVVHSLKSSHTTDSTRLDELIYCCLILINFSEHIEPMILRFQGRIKEFEDGKGNIIYPESLEDAIESIERYTAADGNQIRDIIHKKMEEYRLSSKYNMRKQSMGNLNPVGKSLYETQWKKSPDFANGWTNIKRNSKKYKIKYETTCSKCGISIQVPFKPDGIRPVYCREHLL